MGNAIKSIYQQGMPSCIINLDLERLIWKITHASESVRLTEKDAPLADREYRRFLALIYVYPNKSLVPSPLVDEIWHNHILDTQNYHKDCELIFGRFLHHCPQFGIQDDMTEEDMEKLYSETLNLYEQHFGPYPKKLIGQARCQGKPCHAPTPCRCR
jgi:hypothetical protein